MVADRTDRLTITNRPWMSWFIGTVCAIVGLFALLEVKDSPLFGIIFLAGGLGVLLLFGSVTSLTLDRLAGTATVRHQGLQRSARTVPLSEVTGATVQSHRSSKGGATYRLALALRAGNCLPVNSIYESGWRAKSRQADRVNGFLGVGRPRAEDAFVQVPGGEGVTDGIAWQLHARSADWGPPVTRWHAKGAGLEGGFLLVLQTGYRVAGLSSGGPLVAALARKTFEGVLSVYGFDPSEIPELGQAVTVEAQDPILAEHFVTLTTRPDAARRWLNGQACQSLAAWAARHPARAATGGEMGSVCVVTAPNGLWISALGAGQDPAWIAEVTGLGTTLVRAHAALFEAGENAS